MNKIMIISALVLMHFDSFCSFAQSGNFKLRDIDNPEFLFTRDRIIEQMKKILDWQLENMPEKSWKASINDYAEIKSNSWVRSTFYTGVMAAYKSTNNDLYLEKLFKWGKKNNWHPGERIRHADDHCCIQTYADLYLISTDVSIIQPAIKTFDEIVNNPMLASEIGWKKELNWMWCDALFMAPPAMVKLAYATSNQKYIETMDLMYKETYNYLYDINEKLFYRDDRFKPDSEPQLLSGNGRPIFWSRGNGWVIAGLAKMLEFLPADCESKKWYEDLFLEMSGKIKTLQNKNGLWHSNLLDPVESPEPESSGTALFCYALSWGVNAGYLEIEIYLPIIKKAWIGLNRCLDENGQLHWVQLIGSAPAKVKYEDSVEYATGAFLLAASEVVKLF